MDKCMAGCVLIKTLDDLERTITNEIWAFDWESDDLALLGESTVPYPMSHHVDDLGCDIRCVRDSRYLGMGSCTLCMEGGVKWQDPKNVTKK